MLLHEVDEIDNGIERALAVRPAQDGVGASDPASTVNDLVHFDVDCEDQLPHAVPGVYLHPSTFACHLLQDCLLIFRSHSLDEPESLELDVRQTLSQRQVSRMSHGELIQAQS